MKKYLGLLLMIFYLMLGGCQSEVNSDPETVLHTFFDAMAKGNISEARQYATSDSKSLLDMMETISKFDSTSSIETSRYLSENVEFGKAKIVGDEATIAIKNKKDEEKLEFILRKEKGIWKVAFDINTILTIGMQKMREKGIQNTKNLNDVLSELNSIGADSLKKDASEEMKKLDDVLKSIKIDSIQE
jgi:hypothetical protein